MSFYSFHPILFSLSFLYILTLTHALPQPQPQQPQAKNRPYSNQTFLASHDSPFVGSLPQHNQNLNITAQLNLGIRFLQAQTHRAPGNETRLQLCHTNCALENAGPLANYLRTVGSWLEGHPGEVVTLLLTNGDRVDVGVFGEAFVESGLEGVVFVPGHNGLGIGEWPSVEEMVGMGKRVVVFLDYGANTTKTPYILDEFTYFFETPYGVTDPAFSNCTIDRPPGASPEGRMYIVNHMLNVEILGITVPDRVHAARTNAARGNGSIGAQAELCSGLYGRRPNVVLVDFVEQGEVMEAQGALNS